MHPQELLVGRFAHVSGWTCVEITGSLQMPQDRLQPLGPLGMPSRNAMFDHSPIRVQGDGHDLLIASQMRE